MNHPAKYDAVIIGAGFYGCSLALYLKKKGLGDVLIIEREAEIMQRSSYQNQARVHNGYHYPRSFITGVRSRINFPLFSKEYDFAIKKDFTNLYAIARKNSKITPNQFERFMKDIEVPFEAADSKYLKHFDPRLVASVYLTQEFCFDAKKLKAHFLKQLNEAGINILFNTEVTKLSPENDGIKIQHNNGAVQAELVLNCSYAGLNNIVAHDELTPLKHEFVEMCLISPPQEFENTGITVMDGSFFSMMPFPAENCHSFSHVNYTPHSYFIDKDGKRSPLEHLESLAQESRFNYMLADAVRFIPSLKNSKYIRSMFEVKTVLVKNESNDGRPILFRRENHIHPKVFSILGGKIDNIYDIYKQIDIILK
jgi:glycine/D-amino acid oxidase-like deaminating enzyme